MMGRTSRLALVGIWLAPLLGIFPEIGAGQVLAVPTEPFDCVVEPKSTIELGSPEEGIITEILVDRGDLVKRGQVVAKLDSDLQRLAIELMSLRATSTVDLRTGQARLAFRQSELRRLEMLHDKNIASTKSRDEGAIEEQLAELAVESAQLERELARVELEQAKARLERRVVRSPVNGVVAEVSVGLGEYVYEQVPVMKIAEIDPLNVEVFVPVRHYRGVAVDMLAEVTLEPPIGGPHKARVTVVDRVFDSASRTFGVRLELPNRNYVLPAGLNCKVQFLNDPS